MGSIEIPFDIGQKVWQASTTYSEELITCPECNGDKYLTVIQGNGEKFTIDCACCSHSYEPPRGKITKHTTTAAPKEFICAKVSMGYYGDFRYIDSFGHSSDVKDMLYATKEECQKRCDEINEQFSRDEERKVIIYHQSKRRDLAWSVHYWGSEAARFRKELKIIEDRLNVCKKMKDDE